MKRPPSIRGGRELCERTSLSAAGKSEKDGAEASEPVWNFHTSGHMPPDLATRRTSGLTWRQRLTSRAAIWLLLYIVLAVAPLVLLTLGPLPPRRSLAVEFAVALGIVAFAMMALQFAVTSRFRHLAPSFGTDAQLLFHRIIGFVAVGFVVAHPILLIAAEPKFLEYLDPRVNALRTVSLVAAMLALVALLVLSLWRKSLKLSYEWWRLTHGGLALLVIGVGLAHGLKVEHYITGLPKQALWVVIAGTAAGLLGYVRLVKPYMQKRRAFRVAEVREERGRCWTLVLEPEGHGGLEFQAGQYIWLTVGDSPFSLQQHPFSLCSSAAAPRRIEVTAKELGDFTATFKDVKPGTHCFLEGPYGAFTLAGQSAGGAVFIMGGIGVTPAMSILRTCRDRGDQRPLILIYANNQWDEVTFREELEELKQGLNLRMIHVLAKPAEDWQGERGYITGEMLDRLLPQDDAIAWHYFVCGPLPMMDQVERALDKRGVPVLRRSVEQFDIV